MTPSTIYMHAATLTRDSYNRIAATGGSASVSTESEQSAGQGYPPTWQLREHNIPVSLSMDTSVWWSGDLFSAMRTTLGADRSREHFEAHSRQETVTHCHLRAEDVVDFATRGGSRALGLDSVTGSIEPGKKADLVLIKNDASPVMFPLLNPYGHVAFQAQRGDIHTVVVNGRVVKYDHRLVGIDLARARQVTEQTVEYLQGQLGPEAWTEGMPPGGPGDQGARQPLHLHRVGRGLGPVEGHARPRSLPPRWPLTATMRAALIRSHGQPPEYQDHPVPPRRTGQALIRVTAAPVCPLDLLCASGTSYFGQPPLPYAPGAQGVGIIEEADTLPAGQRVWFSCDAGMKPGDGAMAERCVAEESSILPLPDDARDDLVAALGLSAIAAWTALTLRAGLQPGEHVLVLGASGTVGQVGVQAARLLGAGRVTAACRDAHGRARATELGADAVADLTADDTDTLAARLAEATGGRVDLVLDPVWGMPAEAALRILSPHGRLVNLGSSAAPLAALGSATLRSGTLSVLGYTNAALSHEQKAEALAEILRHATAGHLTADRETLPLARAAEGWSRCGKPPHRRAVLIP